mgnify:FL=1
MAVKKGKIKSKSQAKREKVMKKDVIHTSPVPPAKIPMLNFTDVVREVLEGKHLTRVSWDNKETFVLLREEFLMIHISGKYHQLMVSLGDMEGIDWYVLPQSN